MSAWDTEVVPPNLVSLGQRIRAAFNLEAVAIGTKGDRSHTYGGHRSRDWIYESGDGADDYTVQLALDQGGDGRWISAIDISLDEARMIAVTGRLITALRGRDPRCRAVREVFGTLDGRNVASWDAAFVRAETADDSHLWHIHLTLYRSLADADHSGILAVMTGQTTTPEESDMEQSERLTYKTGMPDRTIGNVLADLSNLRDYLIGGGDVAPGIPGWPRPDSPLAKLLDLTDRPTAELVLTAEQLDVVADRVAAKLAALVPTAEQIAIAVAVEDHRRSAE